MEVGRYFSLNFKEWSRPVVVERTLVTMLDTPLLTKQPKGVVLIIGPWNYPVGTLLGPLIAVIAAGNTAIVKPSEVASHTSEVIGRILSTQFDPVRVLWIVLYFYRIILWFLAFHSGGSRWSYGDDGVVEGEFRPHYVHRLHNRRTYCDECGGKAFDHGDAGAGRKEVWPIMAF